MRILINKLLISFKKSFANVDSTHEIFNTIKHDQAGSHNSFAKRQSTALSYESGGSRKGNYSSAANKRYSSINFPPKFEYGPNRPTHTAYTTSTGKRQTYYVNNCKQMRILESNLTEIDKDYKILERRSATLEPGFSHPRNNIPVMYKSKSRLQVKIKFDNFIASGTA